MLVLPGWTPASQVASSSSFLPIRRRPGIDAPGRPDRGPGAGARASAPPAGTGACSAPARPGPLRSEIRGRRGRPSRTPGGPGLRLDGSGRPGRRRRVDLGLPGGSARCPGAVGGGSRRDAYCDEVGRRQEEHRRGWSQGVRVQVGVELVSRIDGHGHPGKEGRPVTACSGRCEGRRPAAGCRGRAVVQVGARGARQGGGRGEPRVRQGDGSPRARASPVAVGKDRAGLWEDRGGRCGQPVG